MSHRIVILGGGTGGTLMANRLRRAYDADAAEITVVDRDDAPRLPARPAVRAVRPGPRRRTSSGRGVRQLHDGIDFRQAEVDRVDVRGERGAPRRRRQSLDYDVLIVATGAGCCPRRPRG